MAGIPTTAIRPTRQTEYITRREFDEFVAGLKTKTKKEDKME